MGKLSGKSDLTVGELIAKLQQFDDDNPVVIKSWLSNCVLWINDKDFPAVQEKYGRVEINGK